jgi:hypothetical protein
MNVAKHVPLRTIILTTLGENMAFERLKIISKNFKTQEITVLNSINFTHSSVTNSATVAFLLIVNEVVLLIVINSAPASCANKNVDKNINV